MKTLRLLPLLSATLVISSLLTGCPSEDDKSADDTSGTQYWCESLTDANTYYIEDGGGNGASGAIRGRIITSYGDDIHAPQLIGRLEFTLKSITSGGSPQLEETDDYGEFAATVGEGTWQVQASTSVAGQPCLADYEFEVVGSKTTYACVELSCD